MEIRRHEMIQAVAEANERWGRKWKPWST
jgi:hypothetical protein